MNKLHQRDQMQVAFIYIILMPKISNLTFESFNTKYKTVFFVVVLISEIVDLELYTMIIRRSNCKYKQMNFVL